MKTKGHT